MTDDPHHEHLIKELEEQFKPLFDNAPQGIYLYLDDTHKTCNKKFADMLGYSSPDEWIANEFPVGDIIEEDRDRVIQAFMNASEKLIASTMQAGAMTKGGNKIQVEITMVPFPYKNETFVLHFITGKK